ncbi:timeless domain containing protein [Nitzschia inconspicua]|uniref:Timeless domain containing protein n=1 Tax=Nitzschia inconspicua TaxID=303405 RepID=A0A9K3M746_9STRA|nr:timeless domain containing protein [Nitzschia inconspicua]
MASTSAKKYLNLVGEGRRVQSVQSAPPSNHVSQAPEKKTTTRNVTPNMKHTKTSLDRRMMVDKEVVDELLLVCGVIGTESTNDAGKQSFVPVTDCLNWLQDMQRALRRDEDLYRPISLLIGRWKVVEKKLLPLVMTCRYDTAVVLTVVKILVILTKPLAENSKRAGQLIINGSSKKDIADQQLVLLKQQQIRDNALEQAQQLMEYKRLFTFHPSHNETSGGKSKGKKEGTGLLSIFVSLLAEPLSKSGASRTDADHLTIELVLHLIRNLLSAEPLMNTSPTTSQEAALLHQNMISLFERELVLDILLVVGQEMELRENSQYNLLMMEILHHILKAQDPSAVAKGISGRRSKDATKAAPKSSSSMHLLSSKLKEEQAQRRNLVTSRHGHFGGTWMQKHGGTRQFISSAAAVHGSSGESQLKHLVQAKRKNRLAEPFIGSGKSLVTHTRLAAIDNGPATKRANETLNKFCHKFMADCYGPFMKSLKNEFRRDSVRLEESDKVIFFRLIWFFSQWWRASSSSRSKAAHGDKKREAVGRLIITMDVFTFNLVLNATESFYNHKKYARLAQAVALYSEMIHLLHDMYTSKDKTEHEMAMGLIDRLFYGQEALDQIPKLISRWSPGTFTREYLCDLVEVIHMCLKLLEANTRMGIEHVQSKGGSSTRDVSQKIAKMLTIAAEFDIRNYLVRKIVSNQMITMYGHLLSQYKINSTVVNHRIISMFLRLMSVEISSPDMEDADSPLNPLGTKRTTLEPMLYHLQLIVTMEQILNDTSIRGDEDFDLLIQFCTSLMYKFWAAADSNPMVYVESMFRHVTPHRFCELVTNLYVNEDLRMLSERAVLLEEHYELQEEYEERGETKVNRAGRDNEEEEGELEFTGDAVAGDKATNNDDFETEKITNKSVGDSDTKQAQTEEGRHKRKRKDNDSTTKLRTENEMRDVQSSKIARRRTSSMTAGSSDNDIYFGRSNSISRGSNSATSRNRHSIEEDNDEGD